MTCSATCSSRGRALAHALVLAAAVAGAGCAHAPSGSATPERPRIAVLPLDNPTGVAAPVKSLRAAIAAALDPRFELVEEEVLERFLSRHRMRFTGGIDAQTARAAREELGAEAVLVTTLEQYRRAAPPAFGLAMRLVSTEETPVILWMAALSRAGDESPGLLGLGIVSDIEPLEKDVVARLAGSLVASVDGVGARATACGGLWYGPKLRFRSALLDERKGTSPTLAVIPFLNLSDQRGAGEAISLEFVRHLVATGKFRVIEPGVVRDFLLRQRVMIPGGVSLDTTRILLVAMEVDFVVSGVVLDYDQDLNARGPGIRFTASLLEGQTGAIAWQSGSYNRGDDGVFAFGLGRVGTPGTLTCNMVGEVVRALEKPGESVPVIARDERFQYTPRSVEARARATEQSGAGSGNR